MTEKFEPPHAESEEPKVQPEQPEQPMNRRERRAHGKQPRQEFGPAASKNKGGAVTPARRQYSNRRSG